jgi:deoxycytidylate deaminase
LLAVVTDPDTRRDDLAEQLATAEAIFEDPIAEAERLIRRDEDDERKGHGQHVREVFKLADAYVPMTRGQDVDAPVLRVFEGIFAKPFHTPALEEVAMSLAFDVSLRSAAMGRQVGAVLRPVTGGTYVLGTNEVPKPGGGQYWTGDDPDFRDFSLDDDPNPIFISRMLQELLERMASRGWLEGGRSKLTGDELLRLANDKGQDGKSLLSGTRAASVIEFTRCLHAEQAAIVNAARQGVQTQGSTLYTTTFPCHECAKFIVGAGIVQVVYIEPYPKSMVRNLYRDLIDMRATLGGSRDDDGLLGGKVAFSPYVGFAPKRYDVIFTAPERREGTAPKRFIPAQAQPRGEAWSESGIGEREGYAAKAISGLLLELYNPGAKVGSPPSADDKASDKTAGGKSA